MLHCTFQERVCPVSCTMSPALHCFRADFRVDLPLFFLPQVQVLFSGLLEFQNQVYKSATQQHSAPSILLLFPFAHYPALWCDAETFHFGHNEFDMPRRSFITLTCQLCARVTIRCFLVRLK